MPVDGWSFPPRRKPSACNWGIETVHLYLKSIVFISRSSKEHTTAFLPGCGVQNHQRDCSMRRNVLLGLSLITVLFPSWAAEMSDLPSKQFAATATADLPVYELFPIDPRAMIDQESNTNVGGPLRVANPVDVEETPASAGFWEQVDVDLWLWRMHIHSPGATDLNFGFGEFSLPDKARMYISAEDYGFVHGPFTKKDGEPHGEFWSPMVPGERATLELLVNDSQRKQVKLKLTRIAQGFRDFLGYQTNFPEQGSCNIDVVCPEGDGWRDQIRAVGAYTVGGVDTCTGTLVMDANGSFRNFFLTADHCNLSTGNTASMVVYWNFESANCGDLSGGVRDQFTSGATWRAGRGDVDMALVELDEAPDPAYNVFYAGWDRTGNVPTGSVGIHHPGVDEKAISFNDDALGTVQSCIGGGTPNTHWLVDNWEQGTTEPGSSGSALFDPQNQLVIGFLSGGSASCTSITEDCYGKLAVAWDGASSTTRLSDWLDPNNTGVMTVQGSNPAARLNLVSFEGSDSCGGQPGDGVWEPGEMIELSISITGNENITGITGTLSSNTPGVSISNAALTWPDVSQGGAVVTSNAPVMVQLAPNMDCFSEVSFQLQLDGAEVDPITVPFTEEIGARATFDVNTAIPDNNSIEIPFEVSEDVTITDLNVFVQIDHSYVGDLAFTLTSPSGTSVVLLDRPGSPASTNGCNNSDMIVTFDDSATFDLETHCEGTTPWYQGEAAPVEPLAAFNGESTLGTWVLSISDNAGIDTGSLTGFQLLPSPAFQGNCDVCNSDCTGELTVDIGTDLMVCSEEAFTLDALVTGGTAATYSWEPAKIFNDPASSSPTAQVTEETLVTLTVTDAEGCFASASITVTPMPGLDQMGGLWNDHSQATGGNDTNGDGAMDCRDLVNVVNAGCGQPQ
jgi:subtilisin-like proprotein convertase family protein